MPIGDDWVFSDEAARILGIKERTLYQDRYMRHRIPKARKVGRTLMWRRSELEAFVTDRERERAERETKSKARRHPPRE